MQKVPPPFGSGFDARPFKLRLTSILLALHTFVSLPTYAFAQVIHIDGQSELQAALDQAPEGSTLLLTPGDYGALNIGQDIAASVIRSADPQQPARFTSASIENVDGLSFEGLLFDYQYVEGDRSTERPFYWRNARNLQLLGNTFSGDVASNVSAELENRGFGMGIIIRDSMNVRLLNNEIFGFFKGINIRGATGVILQNNNIHRIRSDGMNFAEVAEVLIEGNTIHNFARALDSNDHADMIQFWTNRTDWPSHDIVIRNNLLNSGQGYQTQSIFMRNERSDTSGSVDPTLFYRNILIENNVIINAHRNAIFVGDTVGLTIRQNTVVQNPNSAAGDPTSSRYIPDIRVADVSQQVEIVDNITSRVIGYAGQSDWHVDNNLNVQNQSPLEPGYYGSVFTGGRYDDVDSFRHREGGAADRPGLGAELLR